ncbi:UBX domain-containing protein 1, partial [Ophiophagus hannah]
MEPVLISSPSQEPPVKREYDQCKIQEQLAAVRLYVELNRKDGGEDPFHLLTSFPRRVFTEEDMEKPLQELGEFGGLGAFRRVDSGQEGEQLSGSLRLRWSVVAFPPSCRLLEADLACSHWVPP